MSDWVCQLRWANENSQSETRLAVGIMFSLSRPRGRGTEKRANYSITRLRRLNMLKEMGQLKSGVSSRDRERDRYRIDCYGLAHKASL